MRPRLLNPAREQNGRPERRSGRERRARIRGAERRQRGSDVQRIEAPAAERRAAIELPAGTQIPRGGCDPAVEQVRRAGGPCDQAVYACGCGYLFSAAVSTTVSCPHCGTGQAW